MEVKMLNHPEQTKDEVYLGNAPKTRLSDFPGLKTMTVGQIAYDIHSKKIKPSEGFKPLFIIF